MAVEPFVPSGLERDNPLVDESIRRALPSQHQQVADVLIASRLASIPAIPAPVHDEADMRGWVRDVVLSNQEVWVIDEGDAPNLRAVLVLSPGWIEHLYVAPGHTRSGLGSELVRFAQDRAADSLDLWTFVSNHGARRFDERHGFVEVDRTDGDNEEGEPDVRLRWVRGPRST